jgi:hypothetical protein
MTLQKLILNSNLNLKEGEYQFDNLKLHLKQWRSQPWAIAQLPNSLKVIAQC